MLRPVVEIIANDSVVALRRLAICLEQERPWPPATAFTVTVRRTTSPLPGWKATATAVSPDP